MAYFSIHGGAPLTGSVRLGGAKNASYKLMIASLLADSQSRLLNFSHISDVESVEKILVYLGARVSHAGERSIFIDPVTMQKNQIHHDHGEQGRFSTMFIPVLLHRFGSAQVPAPGGDKLGSRPLDRHFDGLRAMGADISTHDGLYLVKTQGLRGTTYRFAKNTHTGTETLILAAVKAKGTTVLENAALEPEIDDLISFLNHMGAKITRLPDRIIKIQGVDQLHGAIHSLIPDRNEAVSYACTALATKGDVVIENARPEHLTAFLEALRQAGAGVEIGNYGIRFFFKQNLVATSIQTQIEPGFMTDWQPLWAMLMTQAWGESVIHETIMPNRFQYVPDLQAMGASITPFQPDVEDKEATYNFNLSDDRPEYYHGIKITGPTQLQAGKFAVRDLRHGATLVGAALCARGESIITQIEHIDRGYEALDQRLNSMGARISRHEAGA